MHFEADNGPRALCKLCDGLKLKSWTSAPQGLSRLPFGLQVQCLCYHPQRPLIAVGLERCLGEYDYLTGAKLGCTQFFASPVALSYLPDGNAVAVLTQNGGITAWSTVTWRSRTVCTPVEKLSGSKGLSEGFLAVGHNLLFFAGFMRTTVRCAMWEPGAGPKKPIRLKLDSSKKPVAGLQCPPSGKQLYVAYADCTVRGFNVGSNTPIFSISVPVKDARPPSGAAVLSVSRHPHKPSCHLILAAYGNGCIGAWEAADGQQPSRLGLVELPDAAAVVGLGVSSEAKAIVAIAQGSQRTSHTVHAWRILQDAVARETRLADVRVEPQDIGPLVFDGSGSASDGGTPSSSSFGHWWCRSSWRAEWRPGALQLGIRLAAVSPADGTIAVLFRPPLSLLKQPTRVIGELSGEEAAVARSLLTVPVIRVVAAEGPSSASPTGRVAPMHTPTSFWTSASRHSPLVFRRGVHVLSGNTLQVHSPGDGSRVDSFSLPSSTEDGQSLQARTLVYSDAQAAWLVFFSEADRKAAKGSPASTGRFTLLMASQIRDRASPWLLPGVSGAFVGRGDRHFAVLEPSMDFVAVYRTEAMAEVHPPLYRAALERCAGELFPGPILPAAEAGAEAEDPEPDLLGGAEAGQHDVALGSIAWVRLAPPALCLARLPGAAPGPEGAPEGSPERGRVPQLGPLAVSSSLPLGPAEGLRQVAWQPHEPDTELPPLIAGAVLTDERLALVDSNLKVLLQHPARAEAPGAAPSIINCLWVGPALLYINASGQVMMMGWDGSVTLVCSVADVAPAPVLVGALSDRLLLLRASQDGEELCSRAASLFHPLAAATASLASRGGVRGGVPAMRAALRRIASSFGAGAADRNTLASVAARGAGDLAVALAASLPDAADPADECACHAMAGDWPSAADKLLGEFERSVFYPSPPPEGSALRSKMEALARGAASHGQFGTARRLWEAIGDAASVLQMALLSADMDTLEQYRRSAMGRTAFTSVGAPPSAELKQLASALLSANGTAMHGRSASASSWEVRRRSPGDDSQSWDIAPAGAAPAMKLERLDALQEEASPGGNPIPLLGMPTLVPFLGMSTSSDLAARRGGGEDDGGGSGGFAEAEPDEDEEHQAAAAGEEAQEAARKAFMLQQGGDFDSSSDDDSSNAGSASASEASGRQRLQIKIREAGAPVASPQTGTDALRAAAMNLSLAPPGQFQGLSKRRTTGAESAKASSTGNNSGDFSSESSSPQRTLQPAEAPVAAPPSFPAAPRLPPAPPAAPPPRQPLVQAAPPAQGGHSSLELFKSAVTDMENGAWDSGAALVARAMERADAEAQGAGLDEGKKQQRLGLMAQYLAAMLLLNLSREAEGMAAHRARLLRFTAALGLEARHKVPLQQDSVKKNIAAGNYGYAASVLEDLISKAIATGSGTEHMSELQTLLERCDAEGGSNASVPQDEDPAVFSEILATASVPEDVRAMVRQLHEG